MRILVCNDDGYRADGIVALADALRAMATVDIVAPTENRSGASNSLTLERPLRVRVQADGAQAVDGTPAMAVSLAGTNPTQYATAARVATELVARFVAGGLPKNALLNVNVPDLPYEALRGVRVTRLGQRRKSATSVPQLDPKGRPVFWIGPAGPPGDDAGPGTDFRAIADAFVSVTPLQMDLTAYGMMEDLADWLAK
jgi:5'-nucleotidase